MLRTVAVAPDPNKSCMVPYITTVLMNLLSIQPVPALKSGSIQPVQLPTYQPTY